MLQLLATDPITPTTPLTGTWILDTAGGNAADAWLTVAAAASALAVVAAFVLGVVLFTRVLVYR